MLSKHLIHRSRNRSQVSLEPPQESHPQSQDKRAYGDSPLHSPGYPPQAAPAPQYDDREEDHEQQVYGSPYHSDEARFYQLGHPSRSRSTRSPGAINTNQPTIQLVGPHSSASTPSSAIDDNPDQYYQQGPPPPAHKADIQRKKRSFFGLGSSSSSRDSGKIAPQKLGRSVSVRRKEEPQPPAYTESENRFAREQNWSTSKPGLSKEGDEEEERIAGSQTSQYAHTEGPTPPDKDPLHSPAFPPPLTHEEYVQARASQQAPSQSNSNRQPLDRQGSYQSSWERSAPQATRHSRGESTQQTPSSYHPSPSSATSTSSHPFAQRAPHESLQQYYHDHSRPPSQQSLEPPQSASYTKVLEYSNKQGQNSGPSGGFTQSSMGPPPGQQPPPNRRSSESAQQSQTGSQGREGGAYQPYSQGAQQGSVLPSNAPPPQYSSQLAPQGQNRRGNPQSAPMAQQGHREPDGRNTPPPNRSRDDLPGGDYEQLLLRHDELRMENYFSSTYSIMSTLY